ncbi:hypothetical protein MC885_011931 [Smutsia gigantea]|nr:hypothetical protein MC885_011931 [Smutsia gigantea]
MRRSRKLCGRHLLKEIVTLWGSVHFRARRRRHADAFSDLGGRKLQSSHTRKPQTTTPVWGRDTDPVCFGGTITKENSEDTYSEKCCLKGCTKVELSIACLPHIDYKNLIKGSSDKFLEAGILQMAKSILKVRHDKVIEKRGFSASRDPVSSYRGVATMSSVYTRFRPSYAHTHNPQHHAFTAEIKDSNQDRRPTVAGRGKRASFSAEEKQFTSCSLACF